MESRKNLQLVLRTLLLMMLISIFSARKPLYAYEADSQIEIGQTSPATFPIIIDQPGNYVLSTNITVSTAGTHGLEISADNVTLDLQCYTITGPGVSSGSGIYVSQRENIQIINGTVQGFFCGLSLSGANHQVKDVAACYNSSCGIEAESSLITGCLANSNGSDGIKAESSTITSCTASSNGSQGLRVSSSTVIGCTANSNGSHGLYAVDKCRLEGNTVRENGGYGLYLDPEYSYATRNVASGNEAGSFYQTGVQYLPTSGNEANNGE